jgi:hypothetical protein
MDKSHYTDVNFAKGSPFEAVVNALLKEERVLIPKLGYLSVFSISDRKTVLFKSLTGKESESDNRDLFNMDSLVARPLREGKTVDIPELGNFRPIIKSSDGLLRVSYVVSPILRDLLNGIKSGSNSSEIPDNSSDLNPVENPEQVKPEPVQIAEKPEQVKQEPAGITEIPEQVEQKTVQVVENPERIENKPVQVVEKPQPKIIPETSAVINSKPASQKEKENRKSVVGDQIVEWSNRSSRLKYEIPWDKIFNYIIIGGITVVLLFFIYSKYLKNTGNLSRPVATRSEKIMPPLTELAETNYGNSAFWIYIYESNREKLESPVNIPKGVDIIIPNLQTEYGVNPTDSDDIRNAVLQGNVILGLINKN